MPGDFFAHFAELNANGSLFRAYVNDSTVVEVQHPQGFGYSTAISVLLQKF
jgi:hypothetical protein